MFISLTPLRGENVHDLWNTVGRCNRAFENNGGALDRGLVGLSIKRINHFIKM